ncbi:hypothetical protein ACFLTD_04090 [Elusimicrobiota bacterium]
MRFTGLFILMLVLVLSSACKAPSGKGKGKTPGAGDAANKQLEKDYAQTDIEDLVPRTVAGKIKFITSNIPEKPFIIVEQDDGQLFLPLGILTAKMRDNAGKNIKFYGMEKPVKVSIGGKLYAKIEVERIDEITD